MRIASVVAAAIALGIGVFLPTLRAADTKASPEIKKLVEEAFALPDNYRLRPDQEQALEKLKKSYGRPLGAMFMKMEREEEETAKTATARDILKMKARIKEEIGKILIKPNPEAKKKQQDKKQEGKKQQQKKPNKRRRR
ncbi:MAG: hypothetical protein ACOY3P_15620 [Planctomycetota bacterium]